MLRTVAIVCRVTMSSLGIMATNCLAALISPQIGWQAALSQLAHNVSGTATILDEDTIR